MKKNNYSKEEKIAFYKAKLASLENKTLSERVLDLENIVNRLVIILDKISAEKTGTKES